MRFAILSLLMLCATAQAEPTTGTATLWPIYIVPDLHGFAMVDIAAVTGGDIVTAGNGATIRLYGVAAPRAGLWADQSRAWLAALLEGEQCWMAIHPGGPREDDQGRALAYLWRVPDGLFINLEAVRRGAAALDPEMPCSQSAVFARYAELAAARGRGMHGEWRVAAEVAAPRVGGAPLQLGNLTVEPKPVIGSRGNLPSDRELERRIEEAAEGDATLEEYQRIENGMTLKEVRRIIDSPGSQKSEYTIGDPPVIHESWEWSGGGYSRLSIDFENGLVTDKSQFGLK